MFLYRQGNFLYNLRFYINELFYQLISQNIVFWLDIKS